MTDEQMPHAPAVRHAERPEAAAEGTERGEASEGLTAPLCTYDLSGAMMPGRAQVYVQWKGTDVCLDLHCVCGYDGHLDDSFAYSVQCGGCERVYEMPHTFHLAPTDDGDPLRIAFGGRHVPSGEGVPDVAAVVPTVFEMQEERDRLRARLDAVRALHTSPNLRQTWGTCDGCGFQVPCPTIRALDGE